MTGNVEPNGTSLIDELRTPIARCSCITFPQHRAAHRMWLCAAAAHCRKEDAGPLVHDSGMMDRSNQEMSGMSLNPLAPVRLPKSSSAD